MDDIATAQATVTVTLPLDMALSVVDGIRRMEEGWIKSLTEEEKNQKVHPDIRAVRILPNHIARAIKQLGEQTSTTKIR